MNVVWNTVAVFLAGILTGVVVMRYTVGLITKLLYQIKEDLPPADRNPVEQAYTGEEEEIE